MPTFNAFKNYFKPDDEGINKEANDNESAYFSSDSDDEEWNLIKKNNDQEIIEEEKVYDSDIRQSKRY